MHPAGLPKLSHASIDDRITGHALLPAFQILIDQVPRVRVAPQFALVVIAVTFARIVGELIDHVLRIIAPDQFLRKRTPSVGALILELVPDLRRTDLAPVKVR